MPKNAPEISIIIPAYNAEKSVRACLESVLGQKAGFRFEAIVVDDGSTDGTRKIVEALKKNHGNLRLESQMNSGPAVARNNGAECAKGKKIIFLDSDCVVENNWLEEMAKPFSDPKVAGVQGIYRSRQKELAARLTQLEIQSRYEKMAKEKYIDFIGSYSAAYDKKVFLDAGGFDESFPIASGEDTDLAFKICKTGKKMVLAPKAKLWHLHPNTWKKYFRVKYLRAYWRTKVYRKHSDKIVNDSYTSKMMKAQIGLACLTVLCALLSLLNHAFLFWSGIFAILIFLTALPFAFWAMRIDFPAGIASIFTTFARSFVFAAGFIMGIIREARK